MSLSSTQPELTDLQRALVDKAKSIVGSNLPEKVSLGMSDYETRHLKPLRCFLPDSAPLLTVLESEPVREAGRRYYDYDVEAIEQQIKFKKKRLRILALLLLPLALSVVEALGASQYIAGVLANWKDPENAAARATEWAACLRQITLYLVFAGLVGTPLLAWWSDPDHSLERWTKARGRAEALRIEFFRRVFDATVSPVAAGPAWPLLLKFEYFRRWQIEVQNAYFEKRQKQLAADVRWANWGKFLYFGAFAVWLAIMILTSIGGQDEQGAPWLRPAGSDAYASLMSSFQYLEQIALDRYWQFLAIGLAALYASLAYWALISASNRNAARYKVMKENFARVQSKIDAVRAVAAEGGEAQVRSFVDRVHSTMSVEFADWVRLYDLDQGKDPAQAWFGDDSPVQPAPQSTNT